MHPNPKDEIFTPVLPKSLYTIYLFFKIQLEIYHSNMKEYFDNSIIIKFVLHFIISKIEELFTVYLITDITFKGIIKEMKKVIIFAANRPNLISCYLLQNRFKTESSLQLIGYINPSQSIFHLKPSDMG
jgi:hypothetical protein